MTQDGAIFYGAYRKEGRSCLLLFQFIIFTQIKKKRKRKFKEEDLDLDAPEVSLQNLFKSHFRI